MNFQKAQFLNLRNMPARLRAEEVVWIPGFNSLEIPLLVSGGLLRPLGNPPFNGVKYFATATIEECGKDPKWLAKASDRIVRYWRATNEKRKNRYHATKLGEGENEGEKEVNLLRTR